MIYPELRKLQYEVSDIVGPWAVESDYIESIYQGIGDAHIAGDNAWQRAFDNVLEGVDKEITRALRVEALRSYAHSILDTPINERTFDFTVDRLFTTQNGQKTTSSFGNRHFHN